MAGEEVHGDGRRGLCSYRWQCLKNVSVVLEQERSRGQSVTTSRKAVSLGTPTPRDGIARTASILEFEEQLPVLVVVAAIPVVLFCRCRSLCGIELFCDCSETPTPDRGLESVPKTPRKESPQSIQYGTMFSCLLAYGLHLRLVL